MTANCFAKVAGFTPYDGVYWADMVNEGCGVAPGSRLPNGRYWQFEIAEKKIFDNFNRREIEGEDILDKIFRLQGKPISKPLPINKIN